MHHYHLVRICTAGTLTIRNRLAKEIAQLSGYQEIHEKIAKGRYNYTDSFCHELRMRGHQAEDLLFDVEKLQLTWAKENNLDITPGEQWQKKIVLAQLKHLNPDIVYFQGALRITPKDIEEFRDNLPNLKLIMMHCGFPHGVDVLTKDTVVFAGTPSIRKMFAKLGVENHLLYHSFDERLLAETKQRAPLHPFSFIGSSGYGFQQGHKTRYWELLKLIHNTPIKLWLDEKVDSQQFPESPFIDAPLKEHYYQAADDLSEYPNPFCPLSFLINKDRLNLPVYGIEFFQTMRDSLVSFHRHTDAVTNEVGAMRLFQATGMGSCLMTDGGANLAELYEHDKEVVVYESTAECIEKANYLINHPEQAKQIAAAGQKKTLDKHCQKHRTEFVEHIIQGKLS